MTDETKPIKSYNEDDLPNALPCKQCETAGGDYIMVSKASFADDRGSFGYISTVYKCSNCGELNSHYWELGDWEIGILGKWNDEDVLDSGRLDNYREWH